jgi:tripeptide aminopeptidase
LAIFVSAAVDGKGACVAKSARLDASDVLAHFSESDALRMVEELMAIPGVSGKEAAVAQYVRQQLIEAGVPAGAVLHDRAHRRTRIAGECGNLLCYFPGFRDQPRRLLTAHLDTVPLCVGARPVRQGRYYRSGRAGFGIGADNRAGTAVLLATAVTLRKAQLPTPPLTFCWFVQEEIGLEGSRCVELTRLKKPSLAFNWDGGAADKVTLGATGAYRMEIHVQGRASHAGNAPEKGVSAVAIAAVAIAQLQQQGWHGRISQPDGQGTSNVGVIRGGEATNVVMPSLELWAEARSHDRAFRKRIVQQMQNAFRSASQSVRSVDGRHGRVRFRTRLDYESFLLPENHPVVQEAVAAVRAVGLEPTLAVSQGGLDANWLTRHGIPTVTLGCGQLNVHTPQEKLDIKQFFAACRIALLLATGAY